VTTDDAGTTVLRIPATGPALATPQDALDLIGQAWGSGATTIAVPASRFDSTFFDLRSGLLGEVTQKFVNYRLRLAIVGDVSVFTTMSHAFGDYVRETNAGPHVWFVADDAELDAKLAAA